MLFVPRPGLEGLLLRFGPLRLRTLRAAAEILDEAKDRVAVLSGDTRDSGRLSSTEDGYRVTFGEAAVYLEFGAYGRVDPFLRPAADAVLPGGRRGK